MDVERGKKDSTGEMGQLRQKGGRSCTVNGKLRVEGKGQDGGEKVKDGDRPANKPTCHWS